MRGIISITGLLYILITNANAQVFTDSNLPIVIINTDNGTQILDNPRVLATMKIIYRGPGERNYLTDQNNLQYLNYNGRINIEIRGSSSQSTAKKQYGFSTKKADNITNNNVSLLGMPAENDWIFNGMVFDPALMRDYICYNLSRQIGEYASRTAYCELIINGGYKGLYLLQEKIKVDDERVDIAKMDPGDNMYSKITGGYIIKADKTTGGDPVTWNMVNPNLSSVDYILDDPEPGLATMEQTAYIKSQFYSLAEATNSGNLSFLNGYPSIIDVTSFIDHMLISELSSNADSYQYSTFFHKDRNGKLRAGPLWDNDLTFGNDLSQWGYDRSKTNIWQFSNGDNEGSKFWKDLYNNGTFRCYMARRWNELTQPGKPLNLNSLNSFIDETAALISEAVVRENATWWRAIDLPFRVNAIKNFLNARIPWITSNLGSFSNCSNIALPELVITKIMFHPPTSFDFPQSDDQEFIEITNNGNKDADMSGVYFAGTGLSYQFPVNSSIQAKSSVIIASDQLTFRLKYGFSPFGSYTRHLSNKGQKIILADGFGNIIDYVNYLDTIPWPEADGNGSYLKLIDPVLDNNLPSSWIAANDVITAAEYPSVGDLLKIYPNPVKDILRVEAGFRISTITLTDLYGRILRTLNPESEHSDLDISDLNKGIYLLRISSSSGVIVRKFIKE